MRSKIRDAGRVQRMRMRHTDSICREWVLAIVGIFSIAISGCGPKPAAEISPPNIFLISLDTVRRDAAVAHGVEGAPLALDEFARDAIVLDNAYTTTPFTLPAHMSMFTGLHHVEHGVESRKNTLGPGITTLPEELREHGYATAGIFTSEWLKPEFGFGRGFERYETVPHRATYADRAIHKMLEIVDGHAEDERPLFFFLHLYDAHSDFIEQSRTNLPYYSSEEYRNDLAGIPDDRFCDQEGNCATSYLLAADKEKRRVSADEADLLHELYRRGVKQLNHDLDALFSGLRERGLYNDAMIVLTSDHGEEFREHGKFIHSQVYEESVAVPLLVKLPGQEGAGEHIDSLVALMDIYSMVLAAAKAQPSSEGTRGTTSFPPLGIGSRESIVFQDKLWKPAWGLRTNDWKLVRDRKSGATELFRPAADSGELENLSQENPEEVQRLTGILEERIRVLRSHAAVLSKIHIEAENPLNTDEEERLKALGYVN